MKEKNHGIVEPFNDIYTHDCFINAVLCAARYYQLDYPVLTLHKVYSYSINQGQLGSCSKIAFPLEDLAVSIGLELEKMDDCINNWKEQYSLQLAQGQLIITLLNDYYNPLRIDTYQKEHLPHHILIYDMDDISEKLSVIESKYRTTVWYKNMEMSYDDFEKAHFQTEALFMYCCKKSKNISNRPYKKEYLQIIIHEVEQSLDSLNHYIRFLSTNDITNKTEWMKSIDDICNQVKVEQYIFEKVLGNQDLTDNAANIHQTWYFLRVKAVKLMMKDQSDRMEAELIPYLEKIKGLEENKLTILRSYSAED